MPNLDQLVRTVLRGPDRSAAHAAVTRGETVAASARDAERARSIEPFVRNTTGLFMGTTTTLRGTAPVRVPSRISRRLSSWVVGATGSGKTTAMAAWTMQDLIDQGVVSIALDFKSDFARAIIDHVIPGLAVRLDPQRGGELLAGLRVISPWRGTRLPSLHLTAPGGRVAQRSVELVDLFVSAVGSGELGHRQLSVLMPTVRLLMRTGTPFGLLAEVLLVQRFREALLRAAGDPELEAYYSNRYPADAREGVVYSILSRVDRFLADDATRLGVFGPKPLDPAEWLETGTTVCDYGGGPASHQRFWAAFTLHLVIHSGLRRTVTRTTPRTVIRIDEVQLGIPAPDQARELDDALSLLRSKRCSLSIAHQHTGQLQEYPALLQSLRSCAGMIVAFRSQRETAGGIACVLPQDLPPGMPKQDVSDAVLRQAWELALSALPDRTYLLRAPKLSPASIPVRAPNFDMEAFSRGVQSDIRALAREGQHGFSRAELAAREVAWRRLAAELAATTEPNADALAGTLGVDVSATRHRRRRARSETA